MAAVRTRDVIEKGALDLPADHEVERRDQPPGRAPPVAGRLLRRRLVSTGGHCLQGEDREALAQLGSRVTLNGVEITPEEIDIETLYKRGHMRK